MLVAHIKHEADHADHIETTSPAHHHVVILIWAPVCFMLPGLTDWSTECINNIFSVLIIDKQKVSHF